MNYAHLAGVIDAMQKIADKNLNQKQLQSMSAEEVRSHFGFGASKTKAEGARLKTPIKKVVDTTKGPVTRVVDNAKTMVSGVPRGAREHAAMGAKTVIRKAKVTHPLKKALEVAKKDPGGKMHQLLAARAKLKGKS
jgi:hypothetical protein